MLIYSAHGGTSKADLYPVLGQSPWYGAAKVFGPQVPCEWVRFPTIVGQSYSCAPIPGVQTRVLTSKCLTSPVRAQQPVWPCI